MLICITNMGVSEVINNILSRVENVQNIRGVTIKKVIDFGLENISFRIQSECGKMRTRATPNTDTFHAV